jgi:hypothetical protein
MNIGKFGIELECFNVPQITVAHALRTAGINAVTAGYSGRDYNVWQIKTDGSINGRDGFEVVSPILEGEAGIADARKVCEVLVALGAQVNKSCGFHIHHNAADWGIAKFRNLFKRFVKFETALDSIQPESRRANNNRYCVSVVKTFQQIDACTTVRALSDLYNNNRYVKLNLQSFFRMGSVEFRHHSGTVEADKVEQYIRLTAAMVEDAAEITAIKPLKDGTSTSDALSLMLAGMVRRGRIGKNTAKFYQKRAAKLAATKEAA